LRSAIHSTFWASRSENGYGNIKLVNMSKLRRYSNTAADTTLSSSITASSTSILVPDASNYPSTPFTIAVDNEIVLVTAKSTGGPLIVFTDLERGYDNTVAAAHSSGTAISHKAIADDFSYRWQDTLTVPTWHSLDDEFDDASLDSAWTEVTPSGSVTWTEARGVLSCRFIDQATSDGCGLLKSFGALVPPVYVTTAVRLFGNLQNYGFVGPVFSDGTATTSNAVWLSPYAGTNYTYYATMYAGTFTNFSSHLTTNRNLWANFPWLHLRLDWVNSNTWRGWFSPDGVSWTDMDEGNQSSTVTPTHVGLAVSTWGTGQIGERIATFEHFRVYETKPTWWEDGT
jgi:hypothetical protein